VERDGREAVLTVEGPRPLDLAAMTIVREFGIPVSCEDPPYVYKDDVKDVTAAVSRVQNLPRRVLIPKGGRLEVRFALREDGSPEDIRGLLQALVDQADARFPWAYRLDADRGSFTLVPMKTRDAAGNVVAATPLMDRRVTIPPGERMVTESAKLMADALSAQTGLRVSCCQGVVAGIPWGTTVAPFEAHDEPARSVLKRLIATESQGRPARYYWLERCDPLPSNWCFINLTYVPPVSASAR
jgi:hypothetical protein